MVVVVVVVIVCLFDLVVLVGVVGLNKGLFKIKVFRVFYRVSDKCLL